MSKETQERNRYLLTNIRKGLAFQEDFIFCQEGYKQLLYKTDKILTIANDKKPSNISDEYWQYIKKEASRVNKKIRKWKTKIDDAILKDPNKYLPIYFLKWLGINYIYSFNNLKIKSFYYNRHKISGEEIDKSIKTFFENVQKTKKETDFLREQMMKENKTLIYQLVINVVGSRTDMIDDLLSVAYAQFIQCMDYTFDMKKGTEFSTYVSSCIMYKCREAKIKYDEIIKIPTARMKDKTLAAKGVLDLNAEDINEKDRAKESLIRYTISNSGMYWALNHNPDDPDQDSNIDEHILSDENQIEKDTESIVLSDIVQRIINNILKDDRHKKESKIKALEYSGILDFDNAPEHTLKEVATKLYENGYTKTEVTSERARQLIIEGKNLIKKHIMRDKEFMETLGLGKSSSQ